MTLARSLACAAFGIFGAMLPALAAPLPPVPVSPAPLTCNFVFHDKKIKIQAGDVLILKRLSGTAFTDDIAFTGKAKTIRLGYVVPPREYITGALILKFRQKPLSETASSPLPIKLFREAYISPCGRGYVKRYSHTTDIGTYVDYHQYGARDPEPNQDYNLDFFHADIGPRPNRNCAATNNDDVRGQFLFSVEPSGRQIAGLGQKFTRERDKIAAYFDPKKAEAAPAGYDGYVEYQTNIVPYQRDPGRLACFAFDVPAANNAASTQIMIIDADDAIAPWLGSDPQKTRTIYWLQKLHVSQ